MFVMAYFHWGLIAVKLIGVKQRTLYLMKPRSHRLPDKKMSISEQTTGKSLVVFVDKTGAGENNSPVIEHYYSLRHIKDRISGLKMDLVYSDDLTG
jgi:hypothetical protein